MYPKRVFCPLFGVLFKRRAQIWSIEPNNNVLIITVVELMLIIKNDIRAYTLTMHTVWR